MQSETNTKTTINLKLDDDEAKWLKGWMQNPLCETHNPADEDELDRGMRQKFWLALGGDQ